VKLLFDASALLNLIKRARGRAVDVAEGNYLLTLTLYEICNGIWKECTLLGNLSLDSALKIFELVVELTRHMEAIHLVSWEVFRYHAAETYDVKHLSVFYDFLYLHRDTKYFRRRCGIALRELSRVGPKDASSFTPLDRRVAHQRCTLTLDALELHGGSASPFPHFLLQLFDINIELQKVA